MRGDHSIVLHLGAVATLKQRDGRQNEAPVQLCQLKTASTNKLLLFILWFIQIELKINSDLLSD
jgi:hypothetical protein